MLITHVDIENFKCIEKLSINLAPLTIFVGPNGSGKTSILEAIALMAQSNERSINNSIKGKLVEFEEFRDLYFKRDETKRLLLGFEVDISKDEQGQEIIKTWIKNEKEKILRSLVDEKIGINIKKIYKVCLKFLEKIEHNMISKTKIKYKHGVERNVYSHVLEICGVPFSGDFIGLYTKWNEYEGEDRNLALYSEKYNAFLPFMIRLNYSSHIILDFKPILDYLRMKIGYDDKPPKKIFYISANRGDVPWEYKASNKNNVGRKGEYTIEVISRMLYERDLDRIDDFERFCSLFGIEKPWAGWKRTGDILSSSYLDPYIKKGSALKFPHLGFGSKQILPVITQIVNSKDSLIMIEEPEISLHPEYQTRLPYLFAYAVKERNNQVIVTTHSSYFVLALGDAVRGNELPKSIKEVMGKKYRRILIDREDILIYHVTRDEEGVKIKELELDERGYLESAVPSFLEVEKKLFRRIFK